MKRINDFWVDENGNKWSAASYSEIEAKKKSEYLLFDCYNCVNCSFLSRL